jgi:hypothetical protein
MFKDGRTDVMIKSKVVGRPSSVSGDLIENIDQKICERRRFTISEVSCEFPRISRTVLYEHITVRLGYLKFRGRLVPKMLMGAHKTQRMSSALTFLERYHKDGDEFLNHIVRVAGDITWVSFVNAETKEQSKQWIYTHSPNKSKKFKQTLSNRKLTGNVFWDRKGVLMVKFVQ